MELRHIILRLIHREGGSIASKTKIQKQVYFLAEELGKDFSFRAHYYGPYSPEVDDALDDLIGAGFVSLTTNSLGWDNNRGFEIVRYDYSITQSGEKLLNEISEEKETSIINHFTDRLQSIGNPDYFDLSIAAKVHYITSEDSHALSADIIGEKARKLGWKLDEADVQKATEILHKLSGSHN